MIVLPATQGLVASPALRPDPAPSLASTDVAASEWRTLGELPSHLFAERSAVATALTGPRLARAWASAVVMYWSRLERLGGLDLSQPLYVFNLDPGDGALAGVMLATLREEMHACGMLGWPVRFVLCPPVGEQSALALLKQPALQPFVARGWLDQASWQARPGHPLLLGTSRFALFGSRNPVVAVTGGGFSALSAALYGVHYGDLLQSRVQVQPGNDGRFTLSSEWQPLEEDALAPAAAVILDHYRASLISATVLLSESALSLLDALADFSAGRYLLIAADYGVADERQIRLNGMALPEKILPGELGLPVNFHALGMHQESAGARVSNLESDASGCVQHLACRDDAIGMDSASWESLINKVDEVHPAERWRHATSHGPVQRIDDINFRLRCSGHDAWTLGSILDGLDVDGLEAGDDAARQTLRRSLARTWKQMAPSERGQMGLSLAGLLVHLREWALAREVLAEASDQDASTTRRVDWLLLRARLEANTGRSTIASRLLRECLRHGADQAGIRDMSEMLALRIANWQASSWYTADAVRDDELVLEPLDTLHIPAWLYQYRDPNIASMAGLPPIASEAEAMAYLDRVGDCDGVEYAVVHRDLGMVGAIGLHHDADMAHIHFWIGVDHQDAGFGTRTVQLLLRGLKDTEVRHVFTAVFRTNLRSRRILEKFGFSMLPLESRGSDGDYIFMHLALASAACCTDAELVQRLARICDSSGVPLTS